jgi:AcrR family transcriptional regulator
MVAVSGERGYLQTHVGDVLERSGASRRTFYRHFANREECFLAGYDAIVADLVRLLDEAGRASCDGENGVWDRPLRERLEAILRHFSQWPAHARVLLIEVSCAGPRGLERDERTHAALAAQLAACPNWLPGRCDSLGREEIAQLAFGARALARRRARGSRRVSAGSHFAAHAHSTFKQPRARGGSRRLAQPNGHRYTKTDLCIFRSGWWATQALFRALRELHISCRQVAMACPGPL